MGILRTDIHCTPKTLFLLRCRVSKNRLTLSAIARNKCCAVPFHFMEVFGKGFWLCAYKILLVRKLKPRYPQPRDPFRELTQNEMAIELDWLKIIFCSTLQLTFGWMVSLMNEIAAFGVMVNHNAPLQRQKIFAWVILLGRGNHYFHISPKNICYSQMGMLWSYD